MFPPAIHVPRTGHEETVIEDHIIHFLTEAPRAIVYSSADGQPVDTCFAPQEQRSLTPSQVQVTEAMRMLFEGIINRVLVFR